MLNQISQLSQQGSKAMKSSTSLMTLSLLVILSAALQTTPTSATEGELVIYDSGNSVRELHYILPFTLARPYIYQWSAEHQSVSEGYILILAVDPEFAEPRQTDLPVLFVGDIPAELTNGGYESGNMIVIVPGPVDLTTSPVFFGSKDLPEQITRNRGRQVRQTALAAGIKPFTSDQINNALSKSALELQASDSMALYRTVADLIEQYAPTETDLINQYRLVPID